MEDVMLATLGSVLAEFPFSGPNVINFLFMMSVTSAFPKAGDINAIRENYDTDNPVIAEILKAKEERLKILQELNRKHQGELESSELLLKNNLKSEKSTVRRSRKFESNSANASVRRSTRLQNSQNSSSIANRENEEKKSEFAKNHFIRPPNKYGPVPGVEVGSHWETRMECSMYGVHRPTVAGIHGGPEGAYSIALSGGYPEDVDEGHTFIYTGAGGRDLKGTAQKPKNLRVASQTKDQQLEGANLSLVKSVGSKLPVRVIRGYKSPSIFAPDTGYRYDGLYQVVEYWEDVGKTGYKIYRFRMERMKDQAPPPWDSSSGTHQRKANVTESPDSVDEESELKENIAPPKNDSLFGSRGGDKEVDVDEEIESCLKFFCKAATITFNLDLEKECNEEEFYGWDEQ